MAKYIQISIAITLTFIIVLDYLIIGQGLAGSCLAFELFKRKKLFLVLNRDKPLTASKVAAGIFNPVTGKRMVKTWMADDVFPYLKIFYKQVEDITKSTFFYSMPVFRPFNTLEEQHAWAGKSASDQYKPYIGDINLNSDPGSLFKNPLGGVTFKQTGYLDVISFLRATRNFLMQQKLYHEEAFMEEDIVIKHDHLSYKNLEAKKILLCMGPDGMNSKFFGNKPFRPAKGEILDIRINQPVTRIYNKGIFLLPVKNGLSRVGSNYEFNDTTLHTTEKAKQQILSRLDSLCVFSYQVLSQKAGVRPASVDRRPVIGMHHEIRNLGIFNGFGTKGVSLAPFFAKHFLDSIEYGKELDREIDINRFFK